MEPRLRHLVVKLEFVASFLSFASELINGVGNALIIEFGSLFSSQAIKLTIRFTIRSERSIAFAWCFAFLSRSGRWGWAAVSTFSITGLDHV